MSTFDRSQPSALAPTREERRGAPLGKHAKSGESSTRFAPTTVTAGGPITRGANRYGKRDQEPAPFDGFSMMARIR